MAHIKTDRDTEEDKGMSEDLQAKYDALMKEKGERGRSWAETCRTIQERADRVLRRETLYPVGFFRKKCPVCGSKLKEMKIPGFNYFTCSNPSCPYEYVVDYSGSLGGT